MLAENEFNIVLDQLATLVCQCPDTWKYLDITREAPSTVRRLILDAIGRHAVEDNFSQLIETIVKMDTSRKLNMDEVDVLGLSLCYDSELHAAVDCSTIRQLFIELVFPYDSRRTELARLYVRLAKGRDEWEGDEVDLKIAAMVQD